MLTGDTGHFTPQGDLVLSGRLRNIIVLPNGLNVFPEDIEAALADHGLSQAVVLETTPGRIEAIVLPPGSQPVVRGASAPAEPRAPRSEAEDAAVRSRIDAIMRAANAELSMHQRIVGWRLWPEPDFPRTHTLKIRRNEVRAWAGDDIALKVRRGARPRQRGRLAQRCRPSLRLPTADPALDARWSLRPPAYRATSTGSPTDASASKMASPRSRSDERPGEKAVKTMVWPRTATPKRVSAG